MNNEVSFIIVSCDKYKDLWPPFFACFFKYWPDCPYKIFLVSNFEEFEDERVISIRLGEDKKYSDNMLSMLDLIPTEWFIFWYEDIFLNKEVNTSRVKEFISKAQEKNVGSFKISSDYPLIYEDLEGGIGKIPIGVRYRTALGMSLYRKDIFKKLMIPGKSAWELDKLNRPEIDEGFYALTLQQSKEPLIPHIHAVEKGEWMWGVKKFFESEELLQHIESRTTQSIFSHLRLKIFLFVIETFKFFKIHWR
tara:strand:+ start:1021 stop:1770 length:750 start_codon:yes stop_codon:yes gene_type:complete